jgi:quinol monooxygenase YgiN
MPIQQRCVVAVLCALASAACGGSSEPAAAAGEPTSPTSGAEMAAPEPTPPPEAPPEPEAVAPAMPSHGVTMMFKVKDYDTWKASFDADAAARKAAGIDGHAIMRGAEDPKLVVVWGQVSDIEKAKAFFADKALKDKMKSAGVQGKPEIQLGSVAAMQMKPDTTGQSAALINAKVKDFDAFKAAFESGAQARTDQGISGFALSQDVATPTVAYVYLQSPDAAKLKSYVTAKDTKQSWKEAGVIGPAKVTLVQEGEMVMYP